MNEARKLEQTEFKKWFALVAEVNPLLRFFRLNEIKTPTLYIMGEQDYMFLPAIKRIVQKHESATLELIPNCGHVVNIEQPTLFNQKVIRFLKYRSFAGYSGCHHPPLPSPQVPFAALVWPAPLARQEIRRAQG